MSVPRRRAHLSPLARLCLLMALPLAGCAVGERPAQPLPPPPPPPLKVVKVIWCLVDDGQVFPPPQPFFPPRKSIVQNPGPPRLRFNPLRLAAGLQRKNRIYAPTGIQFASVRTVTIMDPHPNYPPFKEGGEIGDVVDPGDGLRDRDSASPSMPGSPGLPPNPTVAARDDDGPLGPADGVRQLRAIEAACRKAVEPTAPEVILEIVIRRFVRGVDNDADGRFDEDTAVDGVNDDGFRIFGADGEDPIEPAPLYGIAAVGGGVAIVVDPDRIPVNPLLGVPAQVRQRSDRFGQVLAHEDGHALGLGHAVAPPLPRLMSGAVPPWGAVGTTPAEQAVLRPAAQALSWTEDKDAQGQPMERERPLGRERVDALDDAEVPWLDLLAVRSVREPDGALTLRLDLNGLLPADLEAARYSLAVDLDNDPLTGEQREADGERVGTDLRLDLLAASHAGVPTLEGRWRTYRDGHWSEPTTEDLETHVETVAYSRGEPAQVPVYHSLHARLPAAALPASLADGYAVLAAATGAHGRPVDRAPLLRGAARMETVAPRLHLSPLAGGPDTVFTLHGEGFASNGPVAALWGEEVLATGRTDADGAFTLTLTPPADGGGKGGFPGPVRFATGRSIVPLLVIDAEGTGQLCWIEWRPEG